MIYAHVSILHTLKITKVYREDAATSVLNLKYWEGPQRFWKFSMGSEYAPQATVASSWYASLPWHIPEAIENLNIWGMSYILRPPQIQWLPSKLALSWVWRNTSYRLSPSSGKSVLTSPSTTWACTTGCPLYCKCKTHWNPASTKYMNWTLRNQICKSGSASFSKS